MNVRILFAAMLIFTSCEKKQTETVSPPPKKETTMKAPTPFVAPENISFAVRYHIGEPKHRYTLLKEVPLVERIEKPNITLERGQDGRLRLNIPLAQNEAIWGFGQRFDEFNLRGQKLETWTTDGWNATDTSYYAVPFFISSRGYGLFINNTGRIEFDIGNNDLNRLSILIPDDGVELIVFKGDPASISTSYTELVGRPREVPDWIYRPWISRNSYLGAYEIDRVTERMRSLGMPVGVAVLEAWAEQLHNFKFTTHRYPNPKVWIKQLNEKGVHVVCWITSSVWTSSDAYRQAKEKGFLVLNNDGSEHVVRWLENGRKIDFRKPEARAWWRDLHKPLIEMGVEGFKTDGGEHMPDPYFHNQHSFYYQEASLDAFRDLGKVGITFARSAGPLNAGLSTYWAGDQKAEWSRLKMVMRGGLSTSLCGFPFWGHDIGGYTDVVAKELYIRWLQTGAFSPIMQFHGINAREPWHFDEETLDICRFYFQVREKLLPKLKMWGEEARANGTPIIRPLFWHFPDDEKTYSIDTQYMLGPDLIVAPVSDPLHERGVYLPAGNWVDLWSGKNITGPITMLHPALLHQIPLFVRAEAYEEYRELLAGAPESKAKSVEVSLAGAKNGAGLVPTLRYWKTGNEPEQIYYEISNHTDKEVLLDVRLAIPDGLTVEPAGSIKLMLPPGENQRLAYSVKPADGIPAGTYRAALQARLNATMLDAPVVDLVISPKWKVTGLFEGGVGSMQSLDGQPVRLDQTFSGKYAKTFSWMDVPELVMSPEGMINLESITGTDGSSTTFLFTTIQSDRVRDVTFRAGFGDSMVMWLNGKEVKSIIGHRNAERDEDEFPVRLQPGVNQLLIRNSRDLAPPWFYFRVAE